MMSTLSPRTLALVLLATATGGAGCQLDLDSPRPCNTQHPCSGGKVCADRRCVSADAAGDDMFDGPRGPLAISLAGAEMRITGPGKDDRLGRVLACDLDGDGTDELIVAAPMADGPVVTDQPDRGRLYVLSGRASKPGGQQAVDLATGLAEMVLYGAANGDKLGSALACGDLDRDGMQDLVVGAPAAGAGRGSVHVLFGSAKLKPSVDLSGGGSLDLVIEGASPGDRLGEALAVVALEGASSAFLAMGAPGSDVARFAGADAGAADAAPKDSGAAEAGARARIDAGMVFVLPGKTLRKLKTVSLSTDRAITLAGALDGERLGTSLAAGDLDGDGRQELLAGGPGALVVRVLRGRLLMGATPRFDCAAGSATPHSATIHGAAGTTDFGASLAAGDATGDGKADLLVGAPMAARVYLFAGAHGQLPDLSAQAVELGVQNGRHLVEFVGPAGSYLGRSVALVTGWASPRSVTILLGAPGSAGARGEVFLVRARSSYSAAQVKVADGQELQGRVTGQAAGDYLGTYLCAGRLNGGDALPDLLLAATGADAAKREDAGRVYGLLGKN